MLRVEFLLCGIKDHQATVVIDEVSFIISMYWRGLMIIKCSVLGADVMIPINSGILRLGIWPGEQRNQGVNRIFIVTLQGEQYQ